VNSSPSRNVVVGFPPVKEEELLMTMQVGMVGTDGVLIASDTKWYKVPRVSDEFWMGDKPRVSFFSPKIIIDYQRGIAISRANNMEVAEEVAKQIIEHLPQGTNLETAIQEIGERVLESAQWDRLEVQCMVAFSKPTPELFLFTSGPTREGKRGAIVRKMERYVFAGDNVNPATFWVERYYRRLPVKKLIPLAAHFIASASKLSSAAIDGLEIVFCDKSGPHRLDADSIGKLQAMPDEWDKQIENLFLSHEQEFTYAPNVIR